MRCNYLKIKKHFLSFFLHFRNLHKIRNTLKKKRWASQFISFWNYRLQKTGLLKCLKSPLWEHLQTVNMLKCPKDCLNLHGSIFVRFFDHSERKSSQKIIFLLYVKSWDRLLKYWHQRKSILSQKNQVFNATNSNSIISK